MILPSNSFLILPNPLVDVDEVLVNFQLVVDRHTDCSLLRRIFSSFHLKNSHFQLYRNKFYVISDDVVIFLEIAISSGLTSIRIESLGFVILGSKIIQRFRNWGLQFSLSIIQSLIEHCLNWGTDWNVSLNSGKSEFSDVYQQRRSNPEPID